MHAIRTDVHAVTARVLQLGALALLLALSAAHAAVHDVRVLGSFQFDPEEITIAAGDTVRWRNFGGVHNVVADDGSFSSGALSGSAWTYEVTFPTAGEKPYYCSAHGAPGGIGMAGKVIVQGTTPPPTGFVINEGVAGSWFNPATNGQGILLETADALGIVSMAWFTWSAEGGAYDWLTGSGPFVGDTATVTLFRSTGGRFNDPAPVQSSEVGSAQITFTDCTHASFLFELDQPMASGTIPLQRILPPNQACIDANAQQQPVGPAGD